MRVGLFDVGGQKHPNLPLMKISAYHKAKGDDVTWANHLDKYDVVYVSRVFSDTYCPDDQYGFNSDCVIYGGTGYAIETINGIERYIPEKDKNLPDEIEHTYPDYELYGDLTKNTAFGFLTRGCPNNCPFCIVSAKEGRISHKVANLSEFWRGQKEIKLFDANLLACKDRMDLLTQLSDSGALVDFTQGLDARLINQEVAKQLARINIKMVHFAFDLIKNEKAIINGLKLYKETNNVTSRNAIVYILTGFNTTFAEDMYRVRVVQSLGYSPDIRIYNKPSAPKILKDLQRWSNNRILYRSCDFWDYTARGKTMRETYAKEYEEAEINSKCCLV